MTTLRLHWLEAEGDLRPWRDTIATEVGAAGDAVSALVALPPVDVLLQDMKGAVIPEIGMVGMAYRRSLFSLTFDSANEHFERGLSDGTLRRQTVHELHHCLRMGGPGYGRTLGEALVSEGLAGRFVQRIFATAPELWDKAVDEAVLAAHMPGRDALHAPTYDHRAWFFGHGGTYPRWLGYTLGFRIVGDWLERTEAADGPIDGAMWVNVPAEIVLDMLPER